MTLEMLLAIGVLILAVAIVLHWNPVPKCDVKDAHRMDDWMP